jgi:DnaJ-class molecular chaperone
LSNSDSLSPELSAQLTNLFGTFFSQAAAADWPNIRQGVRITEAEATAGVSREITITRQHECAHCEGRGSASDEAPVACNHCKGSGNRSQKQGDLMVTSSCNTCNGLGKLMIDPCGMCEGAGKVAEAPAQLTITVPAGIGNGTTLRLTGAGSRRIAASPGDVLIQVHVGAAQGIDPELAAQLTQLTAPSPHFPSSANLPHAVVRSSQSLLPSKQNVMIYGIAIAVVVAFIKFLQLLHV